jgi:hypothetical protein
MTAPFATILWRDGSLAVSLANFAGPWNLKAVLSVGQMTSEALFRVA